MSIVKSVSSSSWLATLLFTGLLLPACGDDSGTNTTPDAMPAPDGTPAIDGAMPVDVVAQAADAIGGADALAALARLEITSQGERFEYGEGYSPDDAPATISTFDLTLRMDIEGDRLRLDWERDVELGGNDFATNYAEVIAGEVGMATGCDSVFGFCTQELLSQRVSAVRKHVRLTNPHLLLRKALMSPDTVSAGEPRMIDDVAHPTLVIDDGWHPVELAVNAEGEIVLAATREVDPSLGDLDIEVAYSDWASASGGSLRFPETVSITMNGITLHSETGRSATVGPTFAADLFDEAEQAQQPVVPADYEWGDYHAQWLNRWLAVGVPLDYTAEFVQEIEVVADSGVYLLAGASHNTLAVELEEGIVLVDAPQHERRSNGVLAKVAELWPDKQVTHLILTHFHDDHTGGMRTILATGATLVASEHAEAFYTSIIEAPHTLVPDALAEAGITPTIETVTADAAPYTLGTAALGVEVWPVETGHSVDSVMIYVPHVKTVFATDLYSPNPDALTVPLAGGFATFAGELNAAIQAAGFEVDLVAGGHGTTVTYQQMLDHLALSL